MTNDYGLDVELKDFSQGQFERYQPMVIRAARDNYFAFGGDTGVTASAVVRGATIRAAIQTGFLVGITVDQVDGLSPLAAVWLAGKIEEHVRRVTSPQPDPNSLGRQQITPMTSTTP